MAIQKWALPTALIIGCTSAAAVTELNIVSVNNGHMITMQKMSKAFEQANPDIKLKWTTMDENALRKKVGDDVSAQSGGVDVMTIGMYEAPIWAKKGWILELTPGADYNAEDILASIRSGLSYNNKLYAAPFYGESSMIMYRTDLAKKAGVTIEDRPNWEKIKDAAAKMHDPKAGVYGICLRGKAGWGDNMALITTMANSFGGQWFDMSWKPQLTSEPWAKAVNFYVDLLKQYGPPNSTNNSFNEILALFNAGKCGMWIDATIAASFVTDPKQSKVADSVGFAQSPILATDRGANWLWAWALAIPSSTKKADAAQKFVAWATSKEYINLVGQEEGWNKVPTGTRKSTYDNPKFRAAAKFADAELRAIYSANPRRATLPQSPYVGIQFVAVPEFTAIGTAAGQQISDALAGKTSVEQALKAAQQTAEKEIQKGGYK